MADSKLRQLRKRAGVSTTDLIQYLGYKSPNALQRYDQKGATMATELAEKLVPFFEQYGIPEADVMALAADRPDVVDIPKWGAFFNSIKEHDLKIGKSNFKNSMSEIFTFNIDTLKTITSTGPSDLMVVTAVGDNMSPTIMDGDTVLIDQSQKDPAAGGCFAIEVSGKPVVRRLQVAPGDMITISSDNSLYPANQVNMDDLSILGRAVWLGHKL